MTGRQLVRRSRSRSSSHLSPSLSRICPDLLLLLPRLLRLISSKHPGLPRVVSRTPVLLLQSRHLAFLRPPVLPHLSPHLACHLLSLNPRYLPPVPLQSPL